MRITGPLLAFAMLAGAAPTIAAPTPTIANAVGATAARDPDNVKLDASRRPAELLSFFGLKRGMKVLDMFGLNGYWAEITAPVVGPRGRVTVWQPSQFYTATALEKWSTGPGKQPNVQVIVSPFQAPEWPAAAYDFALINLDYHDVYWESTQRGLPRMDPANFTRRLYAAMKPGGVVGVVDHVAIAGSEPRQSVEKLHRIDPAVIRADFERAGFKLEAESPLLRNPADNHTLLVFDKAIRGQTDRVVLKFRKVR
ncbi:methyltransferase [Sphingomonas sp. BN140010]|uniref:Methyltransferase n=1 Tax=Sphingomonas arvum TaxID=2992113 RepID=A0ABT3JHK3_9SPHN|nr:methyltransferase [Sphingomonas sp. BN140010]MCW3798563.1 methyltransferase [Sphingomonas sp. BN140010]